MTPEEREAHYKQMKSMLGWGGWVLAFLALWLGGHLLTRMNGHIKVLKVENKALKTELATLKAETLGK